MAGSKGIEVNWEDDDQSVDNNANQSQDDFASMFQEHEQTNDVGQPMFRPGDHIDVTIELIPKESGDVIADIGAQISGTIARSEFFNEEGEAKYSVGETIKAYVASIEESGAVLSLDRSRAVTSVNQLFEAFRAKMPVKGKVKSLNKGGFEIGILGKSAFCPVSQISNTFVEIPQEFIGQELDFIIEKFEAKGRNIVLSRRALLEKQAEKLLEEFSSVESDREFQGKVTRLADFGAFVDLGGVEGLLHRSEMGLGRLMKPSDVMKPGETLTVNVLNVDRSKGKPRISLRVCGNVNDPWSNIESEFKVGDTYAATVVQLKPFGAFVELKPGVEALLHVSEMAWEKRVHRPEDVVSISEVVNVWIKELDPNKKKISVTLKDKSDDPWPKFAQSNPEGTARKGTVTNLKGFGAIVELDNGISGMLPLGTIKTVYGANYRKQASPGKELDVVIGSLDAAEQKVLLTLPNQNVDDDANANFKEYQASLKTQEPKPGSQVSKNEIGSLGLLLQEKFNQKKK